MNKNEFIEAIKPYLKEKQYKKRGLYWYKRMEGLILCINVEGSQWDKNDYYVNIGIAMFDSADCCPFPTLLHWRIVHRCFGKAGQLHIEPQELYTEIQKHLSIQDASELPKYLDERMAVQVVNQFWF